MVEVTFGSASATDGTERDFAQSSYLSKNIRSGFIIDYIYFIIASVGIAQEGVLVQFLLEELDINRINDRRCHR